MSLKIYKEVTIYDKNLSEDQVIDTVFKSLELDISGINVSSCYLSRLSSIIPSGLTLSSSVDYPYGLSNTKIRQHQTLSMIRRGATDIDLVVNPIYLVNNKRQLVIDDIKANQKICKENNVTFRIMLEYRPFDEIVYAQMIKICKILKIQYIIPSTGLFNDDYMDNLIVCKMIKSQYPSVNLITNGNIWQKEHYDIIKNSGIYGVRLKSGYDIRVLTDK